MTASTIQTETPAAVTEPKPARQSRAARSAAQNTKPASTAKAKPATKPAKATPKPKPEPEAQGPSTTQLKQATVQWAVDVIAGALVKSPPKGVEPAQAAEWLSSWCSYFPGARQGKVNWPAILGEISMAGAPKKSE